MLTNLFQNSYSFSLCSVSLSFTSLHHTIHRIVILLFFVCLPHWEYSYLGNSCLGLFQPISINGKSSVISQMNVWWWQIFLPRTMFQIQAQGLSSWTGFLELLSMSWLSSWYGVSSTWFHVVDKVYEYNFTPKRALLNRFNNSLLLWLMEY